MPDFSFKSELALRTCHPHLQLVLREVIKDYDFSVICGHRDQAQQNEAVHAGRSTLKWPNSKHNQYPSLAVDIAPYPIRWENKERFYYLAGRVVQEANAHGIRLRWGGDWDMDFDFYDQSFMDLVHFELVREGERNRRLEDILGVSA